MGLSSLQWLQCGFTLLACFGSTNLNQTLVKCSTHHAQLFSVKAGDGNSDLYVFWCMQHPSQLHRAHMLLHRGLDAALWPPQTLLGVRPVHKHHFCDATPNMSAATGAKAHTDV